MKSVSKFGMRKRVTLNVKVMVNLKTGESLISSQTLTCILYEGFLQYIIRGIWFEESDAVDVAIPKSISSQFFLL